MEQELTMKNKKEDILKQYKELLAKYKEKEGVAKDIDKETEKAVPRTLAEKTSDYTVENIVKGLANLKLDLSKTLTDLSDKLTAEVNKLDEVQQEIATETKNLEEIYDIKVAAETMVTFIQINEEKKKAFEEEMAIIRGHWEKEQKEHELAAKERDADLKKGKERETEEYAYNLALSRKKDKDTYEAEKVVLKKALKEEREAQEKKLGEREAAVATQEVETAELRAKAEAFPAELAKAVEKAEKETTTLIEGQAKQKAELLAKEVEGKEKVADLKIKTLEGTIVKQTIQIESLSKQLNNATSQAQNIAVKVIEGASGVKALSAVNEIALEQAKNVGAKK